jgi:hypothetical protein
MPILTAWEDPGCPIPVEYSREALERIRNLAVEGLLELPRIGLGVGGLLMGAREGGKTVILDSVTIPCSHANGPSFNLTAEEHEHALELVRTAGPLAVVGWYCSKMRPPAAMNERDLALYKALCPAPWQVTLLIRPATSETSQVAMCSRDAAGLLVRGRERPLEAFKPEPAHPPAPAVAEAEEPKAPVVQDSRSARIAKITAAIADESQNKVETSEPVEAPPEAKPGFVKPTFFSPQAAIQQTVNPSITSHSTRKLEIPPVAPEPEVAPAEPSFKFSGPLGRQPVSPPAALPPIEAAAPSAPLPLFQFAMPPVRKRRMRRLNWVLVASVVVAGTGAAFFTRHDWLPLPPLHLSAADANGHLTIRWNRDGLPEIDHATLTLNDGGEAHTILLDRKQLDSGSAEYERKSGHVDALLQAGGVTAQISYPE